MRVALFALFACGLISVSAAADAPVPAKPPASAPAKPPAISALFNGQIEFAPPIGWKLVKESTTDVQAVYIADDGDGFFRLMLLPENAVTDADAAKKYVAQLRAAAPQIVETPAIEKDDRFALKIHERYKNKQGKTADESFIYRQMNGRVVEIQVQSESEDPKHVRDVRNTAEDVLLSAHWNAKKAADPAVPAVVGALLNGRIEFNEPPAPWVRAKMANLPDDSAVGFGLEAHEGLIMLRVLPSNASIGPDVARANVQALRTRHKKANEELLEGPTIEKDARFAIRIHERYRDNGKVVDETHLYMQAAGRALELDTHTVSGNAAQAEADRKVGEDILLSAHWKKARPAKKPANAG